jgi:hypothetical protein
MASNRIVARLSPHTSLTAPPPFAVEYPPHTSSRGRVPINSFAPARATLHTPSSRHAPTSPLKVATRVHTSRRQRTWSTAQLLASARVAASEGDMRVGSGVFPICISYISI